MRKRNMKSAVCVLSLLCGLWASCADYDETKLNEMTASTVSFTRATANMQGCSFSGDITEIVDCYLTMTDFGGQTHEVKLDDTAYASDVFETTSANAQFLTRITLKRNSNPINRHVYSYAYKPGKLTGVCYVHKSTGVDSTYTFSCANTETSGTVNGDTISGVLQPMTEAQVRQWMRTIYNGGVRADFNCLLNEKGWPVAFVRNDYEVVYDFE